VKISTAATEEAADAVREEGRVVRQRWLTRDRGAVGIPLRDAAEVVLLPWTRLLAGAARGPPATGCGVVAVRGCAHTERAVRVLPGAGLDHREVGRGHSGRGSNSEQS